LGRLEVKKKKRKEKKIDGVTGASLTSWRWLDFSAGEDTMVPKERILDRTSLS
jgi:hypothetical protein